VILDARSIPQGQIVESDVCIIGGGAVGITLAREFQDSEFRTILLESGGESMDADTQSLYQGKIVGHDYYRLDSSRLRFLGGTTNHWGGMCMPFDQIDFEYRPWVPHSGWPLDLSDLLPFYLRAHEVCELGAFNYDEPYWMRRRGKQRLPIEGGPIVPRIAQFSPPTRFGNRYREVLASRSSVTTYLHANVLELHTGPDGNLVHSASIGVLGGDRFTVRAKIFVLAAGAIENARIMLLSRDVADSGIGNQHDVVGRYFMERVNYRSGVFVAEDGDDWEPFFQKDVLTDCGVNGYLGTHPDWQRDSKVMNSSLHLHATEAESLGERASVALSAFWDKSFGDGVVSANFYNIWHDVEPVPNPESRVLLSDDIDELGQPKIQLDWRLTPEIEGRTIRKAVKEFAQEMGRQELGRVRMDMPDRGNDWSETVVGSFHQMGTTRMHSDPRFGVADKNCKVHDIENLYVTGSSVFPTSGQANPTLTIVALALRLGDRIAEILS